MPDILIRAANASDADDLAAIYADEDVIANLSQPPMKSREFWRDYYRSRDPNAIELVAVIDGHAVGHLGILGNASPRRKHVVSFGLCIQKAFHGRGVGSALLRALLDLSDNWLNVTRVELVVSVDNAAAIRLYEKFGFAHEGRARCSTFRAGRYIDALHMARINPRTDAQT